MSGTKVSQSRPLYQAWKGLQQDLGTWEELSPAQRRVAELQILEGALAGVDLDPEATERHNQIKTDLAQLSNKFSDHVLDATKEWSHTLTDVAQIQGLPDWAKQMMADSSKSRGCDTANPETGPWMVTLDGPCVQAVLQHACDAELRETVYRAYISRASELDNVARDNTPMINQILALRMEKAHLLGYESHAHVSLDSKMATLPEAQRFLEQLRVASYDIAIQEHRELEAFAGKTLRQWDVAYYAEKLKAQQYDVDDEVLRPYFSLDNVLQGLFGVVTSLFQVRINQVLPESVGAQVWDDDVRLFEVRGSEGDVVAYFFLDPYARAATKRAGAWMNEVTGRSRCLGTLPVAHMVTNQPPPSESTPSLMSFRDVETLFHECGHALQHMLTNVDEGMVSGIRGVEWDAVEQVRALEEELSACSLLSLWSTGATIPVLFKGWRRTIRLASRSQRS